MATTRRSQPQRPPGPKRGEIYLTNLDPTVGREIQKIRPALVIQNDVANRFSDVTIVAPITSIVRFPLNPVHVLLTANRNTGLAVVSVAVFNQIRAVDLTRLVKRLGLVGDDTMERADEAILISLGIRKL